MISVCQQRDQTQDLTELIGSILEIYLLIDCADVNRAFLNLGIRSLMVVCDDTISLDRLK